MPIVPLVGWILSLVVIHQELYALQCELGTYHKYRKDGRERCKKCPLCNAGEEWNTSVELTVDAEHGYLECYSCVMCPEGYYRPTHSASQTCYKCQLDCKRLNRYGSVSCGYDSPGHCGDCVSGFKADSHEPNDICFKTDVSGHATLPKVQTVTPAQHSIPWTLDIAQIALLILGAATMIAILVTIFALLICHWVKKHEAGQAGQALSSKEGLLPVEESVPVSKCDLETDGPQPVPERTELWSKTAQENLMATATFSNRRHVVDRVIDRDDETLAIIATKISGKNVPLFFEHLQVQKSKIDPEEELWERGMLSYPDFIFNVLLEWTKSIQPYPSLAWLCWALERASFNTVIEQILALKENQRC